MRVQLHKKLWNAVARSKKLTRLEDERLKSVSTSKLFKMTGRLALLSLISFWRRHKVASRIVAVLLIVLVVFQAIQPYLDNRAKNIEYSLAQFDSLIGEPVSLYADQIEYDNEQKIYTFNKDYKPRADQESSGDSARARVTASFSGKQNNNTVSITDPTTSVSVSFTPKFRLGSPRKDDNRISYPVHDLPAVKIYTAQATGIKEDIVLTEKPQEDTISFEYEVSPSSGAEVRQEEDGSLGVYGVSSTLLGEISTGTDADKELLDKARQNGEKNNKLFSIPAPFIVNANKKKANAYTYFELKGSRLILHATGLHLAEYPLSIDPTIYVDSARRLMKGNNETNVDFESTNELIQKSQTTGARIDEWSQSTDLPSGIWDHSTAISGGNVYIAGGRTNRVMPRIVGKQVSRSTSNSTTFTMNMPASRPAGDLYVALMCVDENGSRNNTVSAPGGWTEYADTGEHAAYYKIGTDAGGGNEASSYNWTISDSQQAAGVIIRIQNFDSSDIQSSTATTDNSGSNAVPVYPAITPDAQGTLLIRGAGFDDDEPPSNGWSPSTGHSPVAADSSADDNSNTEDCGFTVDALDAPPISGVSSGTATLNDPGSTESYRIEDTYGSSTIAINGVTATSAISRTVRWAELDANDASIDAPDPSGDGTGPCVSWCASTSSDYDLPGDRTGMAMVAYNGFLYAIGGHDGSTVQSNVWIAKLGVNGEPQLWHPTGGTKVYWYQSANTIPTTALQHVSVAVYRNKIYLSGGQDSSNNSVNSMRAADLLPTGDIGAWSTTGMQTLPEARHGHSLLSYNDTLYLVGGVTSSGGGTTNTMRNTVYFSKLNSDGTMNTWRSTNSFTTARQSLGGQMATIWGGYLYIAGGCSAVNTAQYCTTIAEDTQLASINSDGSLAPFNQILNLKNQRFGYSFVSWQGGLYRLGGCSIQDSSTGACYGSHIGAEYGVINPDGDASTVSNSEPDGTSPCSGGSPVNCDLPPAGDSAGQGGQMSSVVLINNGFLYNIGGCTSVSTSTECYNGGSAMSGNIAYSAINSNGQLSSPTCTSPDTLYGHWCVDATNQINGTAGVGTSAGAVFNNYLYVIGGTDGDNWQSNVWSVPVNADGSLGRAWSSQTFSNLNLGTARGYSWAFTRANPSSLTTYPGNLYMLGGCNGGTTANGVGCNTYFTEVYKCNIQTDGLLEEDNANDCDTANQLQIDADLTDGSDQGLGLMSGTIYANRIYLVGGACPDIGGSGPCRSAVSGNREVTIYARIDESNNIVNDSTGLSSGDWTFATALMNPVRRRAVAFGYNGYLYSLAGYSGSTSLEDLLFAKINVSTGDVSSWTSSGVVVTPRWDLKAIVSNGYVYAIGGCGVGDAPTGCSEMQEEVQTFQLYNNDSGAPISYSAGTVTGFTDRFGGSSAVLNGYMYVAGGFPSSMSPTGATNGVQYAAINADGSLGSWSNGGNLPAARAFGQLEAAGGSLYYIGGWDDNYQNSFGNVYYTTSISSGNPTFGTTTSLPDTHGELAATVWDDRIYVSGGFGRSGGGAQTDDNAVYVSPKLSSGGTISAWTTTTSFNIGRGGHSMVAYANNLYIIGGHDQDLNIYSDVQYASLGYKTGTIEQNGTTITGTGTTFTTAMEGSLIQYSDGFTATIVTRNSNTEIVVDESRTIAAGATYIILDGSVSTWSYTTSLPEPITGGDAVAVNGYMYYVGGRTDWGDCYSSTLIAPISANTTIATRNNPTGIGEWYETNSKFSGDRYGNSTVYYGGVLYTLGGGCIPFPRVVSVNTENFAANTTSHQVDMPTTVDVGDLLMVLLTTDSNDTITDPDGAGAWTQLVTGVDSGNNVRGTVYIKDAAGTEDGTQVDFVTSGVDGEHASAHVYRISAASWGGTNADVEASTPATSTGTSSPDPANLNPGAWATQQSTWIAYAAGGTHTGVNSGGYPTDFVEGLHTTAGSGASGASASSTRLERRVDAVNPSAFTMASSRASVAITIGIRGGNGSLTDTNRVVQTPLYSQPQVAKYSRMIDTDTDVFPTGWLMNGVDNSVGARWQMSYRSMHDVATDTDTVNATLQQNPNEDCGTSATMPLMTGWGQEFSYGNVTLGDVAGYTARNGSTYSTGSITQSGFTVTGSGTSWTTNDLKGGILTYADGTTATISTVDSTTQLTVSVSKTIGSAQSYRAWGGNINCARYYSLWITIDASQTFGYPEDVTRGPTLNDISLFFTADPSKRLRHGKTFTGGEQQPLDTPCRQNVDAECPLPAP